MFKNSQKGFAHILLFGILLVGLAAGVYLVQQIQIFKPKASELNISQTQFLGPSELDNPPSLITTDNPLAAARILEDAGRSLGYDTGITTDGDEINIVFNPKEISENEAAEILRGTDIYYLRTLMWVLVGNFSLGYTPIDPWYALCDFLPQSLLEKIGAEQPYLASGQQMACSDPHAKFIYKKIPASSLVQMIETARLIREDKSSYENAMDFAIWNLIPFFGPFISAIKIPGMDPGEVMRGTVANAIGNIILTPPTAPIRSKVFSILEATVTDSLASEVAVMLKAGQQVVIRFIRVTAE